MHQVLAHQLRRRRYGCIVSARGRFSGRFIADLTDAWAEHGATGKEYPDRFVRTARHLIPKDVALTVTQNFG